MDDLYKKLGFKQPEFVENPYGIRIYLGTKGEKDWCIAIPKDIAAIQCPWYHFKTDHVMYMLSEEEVLELAEHYTKLARRRK